jgi:PAS domain S-box-containing protein
MLDVIVAQGDPISGGAGWVGAGLLGSVLLWLFFRHIPAKDAQFSDMVKERDATVKALAEAYGASLDKKDAIIKGMAEAHANSVDKVIKHCEKEGKEERDATERRHQEGLQAAQRGLEHVVALIKGNDAELLRSQAQLHVDLRDQVHAMRNLVNLLSLKAHVSDAVFSAEVAVWTKSLDGVMMSWNPAAERVMGWANGEVIGRLIYETIIPPERKAEEEDVLRRIGLGETVGEYESLRRTRDGRRVRLSIVTSPIRDQMGKVTGASTIAREV